MAGLTINRMVTRVGRVRSLHPGDEAYAAMTAHATGAAGRIARGNGVHGILPLRDIGFVEQGIMALGADTRTVADGDHIGFAERVHVLAAGPVAVFALNVGHVGERRIIGFHARPVAVGQNRREMPSQRRGHVVKAAVDRQRVGVVADRVTFEATGAVMAARQNAVNAPRKLGGVPRQPPTAQLCSARFGRRCGTGRSRKCPVAGQRPCRCPP